MYQNNSCRKQGATETIHVSIGRVDGSDGVGRNGRCGVGVECGPHIASKSHGNQFDSFIISNPCIPVLKIDSASLHRISTRTSKVEECKRKHHGAQFSVCNLKNCTVVQFFRLHTLNWAPSCENWNQTHSISFIEEDHLYDRVVDK